MAEPHTVDTAAAAAPADNERQDDAPNEPVVFQSRLQAKRLERMQQRQAKPEELQEATDERRQGVSEAAPQSSQPTAAAAVPRTAATSSTNSSSITPRPRSSLSYTHQRQHSEPVAAAATAASTMNSSSEPSESDAHRRMVRGEARRAVMSFGGNVWDAVHARDVELVRCFFTVEGAQKLLRRRSPDLADGGRSLLHCAAWLGDEAIARFLLDAGAQVDAIDTVPSKSTPLLEASRAGHTALCVLLLENGANAMHRDAHGDTAFHWAARCSHGTLLLEMALMIEKLEGRAAAAIIWASKNLKGKTVLEYAKAHAFMLPLLEKRLGATSLSSASSSTHSEKRKSRFPFKTAAMGATTRSLLSNGGSSTRSLKLASLLSIGIAEENGELLDFGGVDLNSSSSNRERTPLAGVQALGLDVASFAYKSRDELASR